MAQQIVAHRGASYDAPENTLAAFRLAWEQGADAIEGDFYLTRDHQIVCSHDARTKRTAGVDLEIPKSSLTELRKLDVGAWKGEKFRGEQMPTLEEVLAIVPKGKKILIEIKCGGEIVPVLKTALAKSTLAPEQTVVICFDDKVIRETRRQIPHIKAYWLVGYKKDKETGEYKPSTESVLAKLKEIDAHGLDTQAERGVVVKEFVEKLRAAKLECHAWTINDPDLGRYFQGLGFDSITTDRPAFLREQLNRLSQASP
ncbi:MAG: glycerophosphodiester phosphodiesterase [Planctomycetales bacterium]